MKRTIAVAIVLALVLSLALPAAALAKRGGVPAKGSGRGHTPAIVDGQEQGSGEVGATEPVPGRGKGKANNPESVPSDDADGEEDGDEPVPSEETSRGVENALWRIERNLERRLMAGKAAPAGLVAVIAKFREWLGLDDGTEPEPGTEDSEPGSEDPEAGDEEPEPTTEPECPGPDVEPLWVPMR